MLYYPAGKLFNSSFTFAKCVGQLGAVQLLSLIAWAARRAEFGSAYSTSAAYQDGPSSGSKNSGTPPPISTKGGISLHRTGTPSASASMIGRPKPSLKDGI